MSEQLERKARLSPEAIKFLKQLEDDDFGSVSSVLKRLHRTADAGPAIEREKLCRAGWVEAAARIITGKGFLPSSQRRYPEEVDNLKGRVSMQRQTSRLKLIEAQSNLV
jgi:hypothetical protein